MRVFSCLILLIVLAGFTEPNHGYLLLGSKKFTVEGSTSIGSFTCGYDLQTKDTLFLGKKSGLSQTIPVKEFGCGNFVLNHDFRKTLKAKQYPEVRLLLSDVKKQGANYNATLFLDIAGKKKTFQQLILVRKGKTLTGEIELNFGDFDLVPPKKLGGAIKINEAIKLSILLQIR